MEKLRFKKTTGKRTATLITTQDSIFGYLSHEVYKRTLLNIEQKIRKNNINFLISIQLFSEINWAIFESKFFNLFKLETFKQGEKMISQGDKMKKIYLIKEGNFELTSRLSLNSINSIVKAKFGFSFAIKSKEQDDFKNYRISLLGRNDIVGLKDLCVNDIFYVNVTCLSPSSEVYSIDIDLLEQLSQKIDVISQKIKKFVHQSENFILYRLCKIGFFNCEVKGGIQDEKKMEKKIKEMIQNCLNKNKPKNKNKLSSSNTIISIKSPQNEEKHAITVPSLNFESLNTINTNNNETTLTQYHLTDTRPVTSIKKAPFRSRNQNNVSVFPSHSYRPRSNITVRSELLFQFKKTRKKNASTLSYTEKMTKIKNIYRALTPERMVKRIVGSAYKRRPVSSKIQNFTNNIVSNFHKPNNQKFFVVDFLYYQDKILSNSNKKTRNKKPMLLGNSCFFTSRETINTDKGNLFRTITTNVNMRKTKKVIKSVIPLNYAYNVKPFKISQKISFKLKMS